MYRLWDSRTDRFYFYAQYENEALDALEEDLAMLMDDGIDSDEVPEMENEHVYEGNKEAKVIVAYRVYGAIGDYILAACLAFKPGDK